MSRGLLLACSALATTFAASQCLQCNEVDPNGCSACKGATCSITTRSCFDCPRIVCGPSLAKPPPPAIWATTIAGGILALIVLVAVVIYRRTHRPSTQEPKRMSHISMVELVNRMPPMRSASSRSKNTLSNHAPILPYPALTRASNLSLNFHRLWHSEDIRQASSSVNMGHTVSQSSIDLGEVFRPVRMTNGIGSMEQKSPMSLLSHQLNSSLPYSRTSASASKNNISVRVATNSPLPSPVKINPALVSPIRSIRFGFSPAPSPIAFSEEVTPTLATVRYSTATARPTVFRSETPSKRFSSVTVRPQVYPRPTPSTRFSSATARPLASSPIHLQESQVLNNGSSSHQPSPPNSNFADDLPLAHIPPLVMTPFFHETNPPDPDPTALHIPPQQGPPVRSMEVDFWFPHPTNPS